MFSNLKIGLRIGASIPGEGNETFDSFIRQHVSMLRCRRTEKNGLNVDIFGCKSFQFGDHGIIYAVEDKLAARQLNVLSNLLPYPAVLLHKRLNDGEHKEDWRVRILPLILN